MAELVSFAFVLPQEPGIAVEELEGVRDNEEVRNIPMDASERPLVEMRSNVDQNVVPSFVDLLTARDIASELLEEFAFVGQLASERE